MRACPRPSHARWRLATIAATAALGLVAAGCGDSSGSVVEDTGRAILDAGNAANGSQGELREAVEKAQGHLKQLQADGGLDQALRDAFCNGAMSIVRHGSLPEGHDWRGYLISQMEIVAGTSSRQVIDKVDELESAGKLVSENGGAVRAYEHSCALRF